MGKEKGKVNRIKRIYKVPSRQESEKKSIPVAGSIGGRKKRSRRKSRRVISERDKEQITPL